MRNIGVLMKVYSAELSSNPMKYEDISKAEYNLKREVRDLLNGYKTRYETHLFLGKLWGRAG
jgi:hypothetical protein